MQLEDIREEVKKLKKYAELLETPDEFFRHMNGHTTELSFVLSAFTLANESENMLSALEKRIPGEIKRVMCDGCKKEDCQGCERYYNRCPSCGGGLTEIVGEVFKYCPKCGQALCQK